MCTISSKQLQNQKPYQYICKYGHKTVKEKKVNAFKNVKSNSDSALIYIHYQVLSSDFIACNTVITVVR